MQGPAPPRQPQRPPARAPAWCRAKSLVARRPLADALPCNPRQARRRQDGRSDHDVLGSLVKLTDCRGNAGHACDASGSRRLHGGGLPDRLALLWACIDFCPPLARVEAWALRGRAGHVSVADHLRVRVAGKQFADHADHGLFLRVCAGVQSCVRISRMDAALVADPDRMVVVSLDVRAAYRKRSALLNQAILADVLVIANTSPAAPLVHGVNVRRAEVAFHRRGRVVNHDVVNISLRQAGHFPTFPISCFISDWISAKISWMRWRSSRAASRSSLRWVQSRLISRSFCKPLASRRASHTIKATKAAATFQLSCIHSGIARPQVMSSMISTRM